MPEFIIRAEETDLFFLFKYYKELIRCKDCKHNKNNKWVDCPIKEFYGRTLDNYCSCAERKEE